MNHRCRCTLLWDLTVQFGWPLGMLEEVTAVAVKRVIALQIEQEMLAQKMTKTAIAKKMRTSRASLNRLLDENYGVGGI